MSDSSTPKPVKQKKKREHTGIFGTKRRVLAISLVIALVSWIIVGGWIKPNEQFTISNVPINYTSGRANYSNINLEIVSDLQELASVTVSGDGLKVNDLISSDVTVEALYTNVSGPGTYRVPLRATRSGTGFEIDDWEPREVEITFEQVTTNRYSLTIQADGVTAQTGYVRDDYIASAQQVEVRGPSSALDKVASAVVVINDTVERNSTYEYSDAQVQLLDSDGQPLGYEDLRLLTITPDLVDVKIPILLETSVDITVQLTGTPPGFDSEWFQSLLTIQPESISVAGEPDTLATVSEIAAGAIDISTIVPEGNSRSFRFDIAQSLPDGVKNISGRREVTVTVNTSELYQRTFEIPVADVRVVGEREGIAITPVGADDEDAVVSVTLVGRSLDLIGVLNENILVQLDATGIELDVDSQQELQPRVYVPSNGKIFAINTSPILCDVELALEGNS